MTKPASTPEVWKEISATWDKAEHYIAQNKNGATVSIGSGGQDPSAVTPMEMLLMALAGCTAIDVIDILRKKRQLPDDLKVRVLGYQRTDTYPKIYTEYKIEYLFWSDRLTPKDAEQAIQLSIEKYCSVGGTLAKAGPIHSSYRILKSGETP